MRQDGPCCPVCDSSNRHFVCPSCINSQEVSAQGQQQKLSCCLEQAEQLREQKAQLLKRLEEHLSQRVSHLGRQHCQRAALACGPTAVAGGSRACMHQSVSMLLLQEATQLQQVAAWRRVQELKAAQAKAQRAKAALAQGAHAAGVEQGSQSLVCHVVDCGTPPIHGQSRIRRYTPLQPSLSLPPPTPPAASAGCGTSCAAAQQQLHSLKAASTQRRQVLEQLVHRAAATRTAVLGTELPNVLRIQALTLSHVRAMLEREQRVRLRQLTEIFPLRINAVRSSGGPVTITICNLKLPESSSSPAGGWPEPEVRTDEPGTAARQLQSCASKAARPGAHAPAGRCAQQLQGAVRQAACGGCVCFTTRQPL